MVKVKIIWRERRYLWRKKEYEIEYEGTAAEILELKEAGCLYVEAS